MNKQKSSDFTFPINKNLQTPPPHQLFNFWTITFIFIILTQNNLPSISLYNYYFYYYYLLLFIFNN